MKPSKTAQALEAAALLINRGQATKTQIKSANEYLNRAYEVLRRPCPAFSVPFDLHQVRDKHAEFFGDNWAEVQTLVAARAEVKALPVITRAPKVPGAEEVIKAAILKDFAAAAVAKRREFDWAVRVIDLLSKTVNGAKLLPVSASPVFCMNEAGTTWVRVDWYLAGRKTAFAMIVAAAEKAAA